MKRIFAAALMVILLLSGCGQSDATAPGFTGADLCLSIDGADYRTNMDIKEVIAALGSDYEYAEALSCDYDGLDKTYRYEAATFFTNPLAEGNIVFEIYTENPTVSTSKGIAVGSLKSDILAAYGEDCKDAGDLLIYRVEGERAALCFETQDDAVWAIYITTQPV